VHLFLDTANLDEIREIAAWGVLDGITTNPTLIGKEKHDFKKLVQEICKIVKGPVSAEVVATEAEGMITEGREIATWAPNVIVKVPLTPAGLQACSTLSKEGIKVNVTLCFSTNQALLAARALAPTLSAPLWADWMTSTRTVALSSKKSPICLLSTILRPRSWLPVSVPLCTSLRRLCRVLISPPCPTKSSNNWFPTLSPTRALSPSWLTGPKPKSLLVA
jgi:hypothetical protein